MPAAKTFTDLRFWQRSREWSKRIFQFSQRKRFAQDRMMIVAFIKSMTKQGSGVKHIRKHKSWTEEVWERFERTTGQTRPEWVPKTEPPDKPR